MSDAKLSEVFNLEPTVISTEIVKISEDSFPVVSAGNETEEDLQYVRKNLYNLINIGSGAVTNAIVIATESQHPRAYEVAGNLIKNIGDLTDKLVILQKARSEISPKGDTNVIIDKAVFIGSTHDLLKMIKNEQANNIVSNGN